MSKLSGAAVPIFKRAVLLTKLGLGLLCVASSVVLCPRLPTECNAMINCIACAVQVFVLVQVLLEKKEKIHTAKSMTLHSLFCS